MHQFRVLHCADLHLDSPQVGISRLDADLRERVRQVAFAGWRRLVTTAIEMDVDLVTVAGDVYDSDDHGLAAFVVFRDELRRLARAGIPCLVTAGNHDPLDARRASLRDLPEGCHLFGATPERVMVQSKSGPDVSVYGVSHARAGEGSNLAAALAADFVPTDGLALALVHANVGGSVGHEDYAPCSLDELRSGPFDAWLLGHVHERTVLHPSAPLVLYPGNIQGRHIRERGDRGAYIVDFDADGTAEATFLPLSELVWLEGTTDIAGMDQVDQLIDALDGDIDAAVQPHDGAQAFAVRWHLRGRGPLCQGLAGGRIEELHLALDERWSQRPRPVYLERLDNATEPELDTELLRGQDSFASAVIAAADELREGQDGPDGLTDLLAGLQGPWERGPLATVLARWKEELETDPQLRDELISRACGHALHALLDGSQR